MEEFAVVVRLYNNLLRARRQELNLTMKATAEAAGVSCDAYNKYENLSYTKSKKQIGSPWNRKTNTWAEGAKKIAFFYNVTPEELFPPEMFAPSTNVVERVASTEEVQVLVSSTQRKMLTSPDDLISEQDLKQKIGKLTKTLNPQEQAVLELRYTHNETLTEISKRLCVSKSRSGQILNKALRKLRLTGGDNSLQEFYYASTHYSRNPLVNFRLNIYGRLHYITTREEFENALAIYYGSEDNLRANSVELLKEFTLDNRNPYPTFARDGTHTLKTTLGEYTKQHRIPWPKRNHVSARIRKHIGETANNRPDWMNLQTPKKEYKEE